MVFKKKPEDKQEAKNEEKKPLTLDELAGDPKRECVNIFDFAEALYLVRKAARAGQIRSLKNGFVDDVLFGHALSKEEALENNRRNGGSNYPGYKPQRVEYAHALDALFFVDNETLKKERIETLKNKLNYAQEQQKKNVEEIEKLSKQLGELE